MSQLPNRPLRLFPKIQSYAWGKRGAQSIIAKFLGEGRYSNSEPYAELWIGDHQKGCADVEVNPGEIRPIISLAELITNYNDQVFGSNLSSKLPFLLKVLSVGAPLSIQAHPNLEQAKILHARDPKNYPDANHKPEMSIALSPVRILIGFRPFEELHEIIKNSPVLEDLLGAELKEFLQSESKSPNVIFKNIIAQVLAVSNLNKISQLSKQLYEQLEGHADINDNERVFVSLYRSWLLSKTSEFDIGIFISLLMNLVSINPGQAIFIEPGTIHAYLEGEMIECMANSDNVVRIGLTPKFKDTSNLLEIADFSDKDNWLLEPVDLSSGIKRFSPDKCEFVLDLISDLESEWIPDDQDTVQVYFCISGQASVGTTATTVVIKTGEACIVPACLEDCVIECSQGTLVRVRAASKSG
jgi:mannose-6-phosphate isomerase